MGCLNDHGQFKHWFGNIHFSGPCNRSCYFCIGQFMPYQDSLNNLGEFPPRGIEKFADQCLQRNITEVNLTGTNTDPSLYSAIEPLKKILRDRMDLVTFGIRTNGVMPIDWKLFDQVSISIHGVTPEIYRKMMGSGYPPDLVRIRVSMRPSALLRVNYVVSPWNLGDEFARSIEYFRSSGVESVNMRQPYGQEHVDMEPMMRDQNFRVIGNEFGMPVMSYRGMKVIFWDVHYVAVHSLNLYADGHISVAYPITRGSVPGDKGEVKGQEHFSGHKRRLPQWGGKEQP